MVKPGVGELPELRVERKGQLSHAAVFVVSHSHSRGSLRKEGKDLRLWAVKKVPWQRPVVGDCGQGPP